MLAKRILIVGFTVALLILGATGCSTRQSNQSSEEEIWELEENYIANHGDANHAAILSVYHEDFLGWPQTAPHPMRKGDMPESLQQNFPEPTDNIIEFERGEIQLKENIAITQYTVHITTLDEEGDEVKQAVRITHTWLREADGWKILGGMSNEMN